MKLSAADRYILLISIEQLYRVNYKSPLNELGIRKLANIQARLTAEFLPISIEFAEKNLIDLMLENMNYDK